jgi:hypothetical protein
MTCAACIVKRPPHAAQARTSRPTMAGRAYSGPTGASTVIRVWNRYKRSHHDAYGYDTGQETLAVGEGSELVRDDHTYETFKRCPDNTTVSVETVKGIKEGRPVLAPLRSHTREEYDLFDPLTGTVLDPAQPSAAIDSLANWTRSVFGKGARPRRM